MKKIDFFYILISVLFCLFTSCNSNNSNPAFFTLEGHIENYNGIVYLNRSLDSIYYFNSFRNDSAISVNGNFKFKIKKQVDYPLPYYVLIDSNPPSSRFLLQPINQKLIIDSLFFGVHPKIISENNSLIKEKTPFDNIVKTRLESFTRFYDSLKNNNIPEKIYIPLIVSEREKVSQYIDSALVEFVKIHPNSYNSFWEIASNITLSGYSPKIEEAYNNLSQGLKSSNLGLLLKDNLRLSKFLAVGNNFPNIRLKNKLLEEMDLDIDKYNNSKYILVDFWFSYCGPCIKEFPKLKELYSKYNPKTLEIIGISTDQSKDINNWKKVINKYNINWVNFLDANGIQSSRLGINKFPTNFLINRDGKIIRKDISSFELEKFLAQKK